MPVTTVNGVELSYEEAGAGKPVVLLPGGGMSAATWNMFQRPALLDAGYRVLTVDLRGMPPSACPEGDFTVMDMAADVAALIRQLDLGPAHVVGYSMGAWTAQELAVAEPDLVRSLTLLGTLAERGEWEDRWTKAWVEVLQSGVELPQLFDAVTLFAQIHSPAQVLDDTTAGVMVDLYASQRREPGHLGQWLAADAYRGRLPELAAIAAPTLVVGFEHDLYTPAHLGAQVAATIPGARYLELAGVGHAAPISNSDHVTPLILEHLGSNDT